MITWLHWGHTPTLWGHMPTLWGHMPTLWGHMLTLWGHTPTLWGHMLTSHDYIMKSHDVQLSVHFVPPSGRGWYPKWCSRHHSHLPLVVVCYPSPVGEREYSEREKRKEGRKWKEGSSGHGSTARNKDQPLSLFPIILIPVLVCWLPPVYDTCTQDNKQTNKQTNKQEKNWNWMH